MVGTNEEASAWVVHPWYWVVWTGDASRKDFVDGEASVGLEGAEGFAVEAALVRDVHGHVLHPDYVERAVIEGQIEGVGDVERDGVRESDEIDEDSPCVNVGSGEVDACHVAVVFGSEGARGSSDPASDVEDAGAGADVCEVCEIADGGSSASVKVLEGREVAWVEVIEVLAGPSHCGQDGVCQMGAAVMSVYRRGVLLWAVGQG